MSETKKTGEKWLDVGSFGWLARYEHTEHWLYFWAYECVGEEVTPTAGRRKMFLKDGWRTSNEHAKDFPHDAEVTISGFVKWDGCCEMGGPKPHFCGSSDVAERAQVMQELHRLCLLLPSIDYDCAGYPEPSPDSSGD